MWSVALAHRSYSQSREFHVALATAGLFAFVNEFAMSVGMALSQLRSGIFSSWALVRYLSIPSPLGRGSRPGRDYSFAVLRVLVSVGYVATVALKYSRAPTRKRSRGYAPMWAHGWNRSLLYAVHQTLSLVPCTVTVRGPAGHNRGRVAERPLLARTQGRTSDCILTPATTYCCRVVF